MHQARLTRVERELKKAKALSLTLRFDLDMGSGVIRNTLELEGMPALIFEAEGRYVIKCLPLNQLGTGDSRDEAFEELGEDMAAMLDEVFEESNLFSLIKNMMKGRAARIYWDRYAQLAEEPSRQKKIKRQVNNVSLETDTRIDPSVLEKYYKAGAHSMTV